MSSLFSGDPFGQNTNITGLPNPFGLSPTEPVAPKPSPTSSSSTTSSSPSPSSVKKAKKKDELGALKSFFYRVGGFALGAGIIFAAVYIATNGARSQELWVTMPSDKVDNLSGKPQPSVNLVVDGKGLVAAEWKDTGDALSRSYKANPAGMRSPAVSVSVSSALKL